MMMMKKKMCVWGGGEAAAARLTSYRVVGATEKKSGSEREKKVSGMHFFLSRGARDGFLCLRADGTYCCACTRDG